MPDLALVEIAVFILSGIFAVLWWLLKNKDAKQEKDIELLWAKHDEDAKRLQEVEIDIARHHYVKDELDLRFSKLEAAVREGMVMMGGKFDKLTDLLIEGHK